MVEYIKQNDYIMGIVVKLEIYSYRRPIRTVTLKYIYAMNNSNN